jgi:tetratricopeptide (TPR) repeat protein
MQARSKNFAARAFLFSLLCLVSFGAASVVSGDEVDEEFWFASSLIERGFPDFAEKVLNEVLKSNPDREEDAGMIRAQLLMANRKFDEAEEIVRSIDGSTRSGRRVRIILARYYYRAGNTEKAKALYQDFFAQFKSVPTDPELLEGYLDAAFKFGQMLALVGDYEGGIEYLQRALDSGPDRDLARQVQELQATYHLRAAEKVEGSKRTRHLAEVNKNAIEIEFGGPYWVGRGALLRAEAARIDGKTAEALEMLERQKKFFSQYEKSLAEEGISLSESPKAGFYYQRGRVREDEGTALLPRAKKNPDVKQQTKMLLAKALNDYGRILKKYPESAHAGDALLRFENVSDVISDLGGKIVANQPITGGQTRNVDQLFAQAEIQFKEEKYEEAIHEYLESLNKFPDTAATPRVLSNLGKCYLKTGDILMTKVVFDYLSERYAGDGPAAQAALVLSSYFRKNDQLPLSYWSYKLFADRFPDHPKAAQVLYTVAMQESKDGHDAEAAKLFAALTRNYADSEFFLKALKASGWDAYKIKKYPQALEKFALYAEEAPEGYEKANAALVAADCQLRMGNHLEAFKRFRDLASALDPAEKENPYYVDDETRAKVSLVHEQATFQQSLALSRIDEPPEKNPEFLAAAIKEYDEFVERFPDSQFASKALASKGAALLTLDRVEEATDTFETLAELYPRTSEGKNSLYQLVEAAVKVGKLDIAREAVEKIAENPGEYGIDTFARVGELMVANEFYDQAISAYEKLLEAADDDELSERAYFGLGKCYLEKGDCDRSAENLNALLEFNRRTGFFFDANLLLAQACRKCDRNEEALEALREIFSLDKDAVRLRKANAELAEIQTAQGRSADAYATYLRMVLTSADPKRPPELEEMNRAALLAALNLGFESGDYDTVIFLADRFFEHWDTDEESGTVRETKNQALLERSKALPEPATAVAE